MIASSPPGGIDPALVAAWLAARSVARGLPPPVPDRGGWRVDTDSEKELRRWVFPGMADGLTELAREISSPRHFLKLCASGEDLRAAVPDRWRLQPASYVMTVGAAMADALTLPDGYRIESDSVGLTTHVRIYAPEGSLAASGHAAEAAGVFIYDRIETAAAHRRRGLGRALMTALGRARKSPSAPRILVATEDGRALYSSLGWSVRSPYSTVTIPPRA